MGHRPDLSGDGVTVLLTTQYLDEADQLADEIVVVDHGRVIATGTAAELKLEGADCTSGPRRPRARGIVVWSPRSAADAGHDVSTRPTAQRRLDERGLLVASSLRMTSLDDVS